LQLHVFLLLLAKKPSEFVIENSSTVSVLCLRLASVSVSKKIG